MRAEERELGNVSLQTLSGGVMEGMGRTLLRRSSAWSAESRGAGGTGWKGLAGAEGLKQMHKGSGMADSSTPCTLCFAKNRPPAKRPLEAGFGNIVP
jgi:hypothetical protein